MIVGYILTGGKNRRMKGKKKLFLEYQGEAFYKRILKVFDIFPKVYLSVDSVMPYKMLNIPMIVDEYSDIGPIGGIYSGLKNCGAEALFVVACDMPFIDREIVIKVIDIYNKNRQQVTVVQTDSKIHPLLGIYPKNILPILEKMIIQKNYRMMNLLDDIQYSVVYLDKDSRVIENINTLEEYQKLRHDS